MRHPPPPNCNLKTMSRKITYDTVTEAMQKLAERGYTLDFELQAQNECLYCHGNSIRLSADEFQIDEVHRFEGATDPGDSMIVYAISSPVYNVKGMVVDAYGVYADSDNSKIVEHLRKSGRYAN